MIECVLESNILKTILKGAVCLVGEMRFRFNSDGLHARAVDPANIAMVIVDIPSSEFEAYRIDEDEVVIGVDVNRLYDISKCFKSGELVDFFVEDSKLTVRCGKIKYSMDLIDPKAIRKESKIPELELPAKIVLDAGEFKKALEFCWKVTDVVELRSCEDGFFVEAEGNIDSVQYGVGDAEAVELNKADAKSMFSLEYLREFCKIAGNGDLLTIRLGTNYPARFAFDVCDGRARVEYILAPRLEAE